MFLWYYKFLLLCHISFAKATQESKILVLSAHYFGFILWIYFNLMSCEVLSSLLTEAESELRRLIYQRAVIYIYIHTPSSEKQ